MFVLMISCSQHFISMNFSHRMYFNDALIIKAVFSNALHDQYGYSRV